MRLSSVSKTLETLLRLKVTRLILKRSNGRNSETQKLDHLLENRLYSLGNRSANITNRALAVPVNSETKSTAERAGGISQIRIYARRRNENHDLFVKIHEDGFGSS